MSTDQDVRTLGVQLPLPLPDDAPRTGPMAVPDVAGDTPGGRATPVGDLDHDGDGWRLDERTRDIGRRGVAEARARLRGGARRAA